MNNKKENAHKALFPFYGWNTATERKLREHCSLEEIDAFLQGGYIEFVSEDHYGKTYRFTEKTKELWK